MKLLYIWIESYRSINQQGFSLVNGFDVSVDDISTQSVHINQRTEQFFQKKITLPCNPPTIDLTNSISTITMLIGKNASGKSSIFECITSQDGAFFCIFYDYENPHYAIASSKIKIEADGLVCNKGTTSLPTVFYYNHRAGEIVPSWNGFKAINSLQVKLPVMKLDNYIFSAYKFTSHFKDELEALFQNMGKFTIFLKHDDDSFSSLNDYFVDNKCTNNKYKLYFLQKFCYIAFVNLLKVIEAQDDYQPNYDEHGGDILRSKVYAFTPTNGFPEEHQGLYSYNPHDFCRIKKDLDTAIASFSNAYPNLENRLACTYELIRKFVDTSNNLDDAHFTAFYKLECPVVKPSDSTFANFLTLFEIIENLNNANMLNICISNGINTTIEWLSSSEMESIRLFSMIYQCISHIEPTWGVKDIIVVIDEPEIHLHPTNAELFIKWIERAVCLFATAGHINSVQLIISTHSPLVVKKCLDYGNHAIRCVENNGSAVKIKSKSLPTPLRRVTSYAEIMYRYFDIVSTDFHDELYGAMMEEVAQSSVPPKDVHKIKTKCLDDYLRKLRNQGNNGVKIFPDKWESDIPKKDGSKDEYLCTVPVYLRNYIHHPENQYMKNKQIPQEDFETYLRESIVCMDSILNP
ncbi:MAG: ATP-binding protein [Defluviitaleaceae bacterium]|nr:ATP-binding protein [Defluviitaleaceae bacterium]